MESINTELDEWKRIKTLREKREGRLVTHLRIKFVSGEEVDFYVVNVRVRDYVLSFKNITDETIVTSIPLHRIDRFSQQEERIFPE